MAMSSTELKALNWYKEAHNLKLQLSSPPKIYFKNSRNKLISVYMSEIVKEYSAWNEEDKKQRARDRRLEQKGV